MIQRYTSTSLFLVLFVLVGMLTSQSIAQTVNVKLRCNTSTCLDTLRTYHVVGLQGESKKGIAGFTNWSTTLNLTNVGGDYWETTLAAKPGDTLYYSFLTKYDATTFSKINWGWDGPIDNGVDTKTNRMLIVGSKDTTLPLQYYNGGTSKVAQYMKPFAVKQDSIAVYFRVNMGGVTFNPATQTVEVQGGIGSASWTKMVSLVRESGSVNNGSFWSGAAYLPKSGVAPGNLQKYQFVFRSPETWESSGDRSFTYTNSVINVAGDTTLAWVYCNNKAPSTGVVTTVNVKFRCNTSTCLDTLRPYHVVGLQGDSKKGIPGFNDWSTTVNLANVNGDYWEGSLAVQPGDTIHYSFITKYDATTFSSVNWGWDGPIDNGVTTRTNRILIVGTKDTTLPLQYYNGGTTKVGQYTPPFKKKQDTVAVYFRVNMGGVSFDPTSQTVEVRGGAPFGTDNPWIKFVDMKREVGSVNNGSFWSGVAYVAKTGVTAGTRQQYQFVFRSPETWESANRSFIFSNNLITVAGDTTLAWAYDNNKPPSGPKITSNVLFSLKLNALEKAGLFNRAVGDRVGVTGAKGWAADPVNFDTTVILKMTYSSDLQEWDLVEPFTLFPNDVIVYKYYLAWDPSRVDSTSPNFIRGLALSNGWEEPGVTGGADRKYTFTSTTTGQLVPGDFGADQQYFNSIHPNGAIATPCTLSFSINMAPATNVATNPTNPLFRPGTDSVFVSFDGCLLPITQGKTMYGTDNRIELKDPNGDGIYTGSIALKAPSLYQVCYRMTYSSSPNPAVTNGGGILIGRRYYQYIRPTQVKAGGVITWPSSFTLPTVSWRVDSLTVETPPDLDSPTGIAQSTSNTPMVYSLEQNYPNPFNPSTVITYTVPEKTNVKLEIYNMLGQRIVSLFDQEQAAGTHSIGWNGRNGRNEQLSSGIYFLQMRAGSYSNVRKMILMK